MAREPQSAAAAETTIEAARAGSDEQLVPALQRGDEMAFTELMRRYKGAVFGAAYRYLGDADEAADAAQEVFVKVFRHIQDFSGKSKLSTWIYRIAANTAIGFLRKRSRRVDAMAESLDETRNDGTTARIEPAANPGSNPREQLLRKELAAVLQKKLQDLPESYRMAFILREMRELSYEEIAEAMDVPVGTVRSRLHQARRRLREMLEPYLSAGRERVAQAR